MVKRDVVLWLAREKGKSKLPGQQEKGRRKKGKGKNSPPDMKKCPLPSCLSQSGKKNKNKGGKEPVFPEGWGKKDRRLNFLRWRSNDWESSRREGKRENVFAELPKRH